LLLDLQNSTDQEIAQRFPMAARWRRRRRFAFPPVGADVFPDQRQVIEPLCVQCVRHLPLLPSPFGNSFAFGRYRALLGSQSGDLSIGGGGQALQADQSFVSQHRLFDRVKGNVLDVPVRHADQTRGKTGQTCSVSTLPMSSVIPRANPISYYWI
jgi:hypothetical protein